MFIFDRCTYIYSHLYDRNSYNNRRIQFSLSSQSRAGHNTRSTRTRTPGFSTRTRTRGVGTRTRETAYLPSSELNIVSVTCNDLLFSRNLLNVLHKCMLLFFKVI
jgi:hypothetical protein